MRLGLPKVTNKNQVQVQPLFYRGFWSQFRSRIYVYYQRAAKNPKWLLMFILGRFKITRSTVAFFSKRPLTQKYAVDDSIFEDFNVDDVVESLKRDGLYLGLKLPKNVLQEILDFSMSTNCYGDSDYESSFLYAKKQQAEEKYGKTFVRGDYFNASLNCPAIKKIGSDPKLLAIAAKYLNTEPVLIGSRMWWLFVVKEQSYDLNKGAYFFHYDVDDYQCLKFFFYLTDVDLSSSYHVCVRGSHKKKKLAYLLSLFKLRSDKEIIDYYGEEDIVPICGEAGFGFAENTFCFHKATPPTSKERLILQLQFTMNDYNNSNDFVDPSLLKKS